MRTPRVRPQIQATALLLLLTNLVILVGHIEWWDPMAGRHLSLPLVIYLVTSIVISLCLIDPNDPCWKDSEDSTL